MSVVHPALVALRGWARESWEAPPSKATLHRADRWLAALAAAGAAHPTVSSSQDGEVTLSWATGPRWLTVYLGDTDADALRSWGTRATQMSEAHVSDVTDLAPLLAWLDSADTDTPTNPGARP